MQLTELLKQKQYSPMAVNEMVPLIFAGVNGLLDSVPVNKILQWEADFLAHLKTNETTIMSTIEKEGVKITLTHAFHSSSSNDLQYLGEPAGLILELEDGKKIYFAGDTCVFGDMQLIGRIYEPDLAVLPIGDHYTMGPKEAALALELLGVERCVPCHWGTFGLLTGTPNALRKLAPAGVEIVDVAPCGAVTL